MNYLSKLKLAPLSLSMLALFLVTLGLITGCNNAEQGSNESATKATGIPKYHKPQTLAKAVTRLQELLPLIDSEDALPEDITYDVIEEIHGTGASAHSHFHLDKGDGEHEAEDHDHDHDHEGESSTKTHHVSVDAITEFTDICRWLTKLAADTELPREKWEKVKQVSEGLLKPIKGIPTEGSLEARRKLFRQAAKELTTQIGDLKTQLGDSGE